MANYSQLILTNPIFHIVLSLALAFSSLTTYHAGGTQILPLQPSAPLDFILLGFILPHFLKMACQMHMSPNKIESKSLGMS